MKLMPRCGHGIEERVIHQAHQRDPVVAGDREAPPKMREVRSLYSRNLRITGAMACYGYG